MKQILSDFLHLFTPQHKGVYSWSEILIGFLIVSFLAFIAYFSAQ